MVKDESLLDEAKRCGTENGADPRSASGPPHVASRSRSAGSGLRLAAHGYSRCRRANDDRPEEIGLDRRHPHARLLAGLREYPLVARFDERVGAGWGRYSGVDRITDRGASMT